MAISEIVAGVLICLIAGAAAAYLILRVRIGKAEGQSAELQQRLAQAQEERERYRIQAERADIFERQLNQASEHLRELQQDYEKTLSLKGAAEAVAAHLTANVQEKNASLRALDQTVETLRRQVNEAATNSAKTQEQLEANQRALGHVQAFVDTAKEQMTAKFGEVAGQLFDQKSQVFAVQSREGLIGVLKPFADDVQKFRERVEVLHADEAKDRAGVKVAVEQLTGLNQQMTRQAQSLTDALRGNAKVRGNWGEMILDTVLQASGLEEGVHYTRQGGERNEEGRILLPDVVVNLPDDRNIVIDSKTTLIPWQDVINANGDEDRNAALKVHVAALRKHVRDLAGRNYSVMYGGKALDLVLLFVPIEAALSAALAEDPSLQPEALDRKVAFVTPNTLVGVLRTIEFVWSREKRQRKAEEIASRAQSLLDALVRFWDDFKKLETKIDELQSAYGRAQRTLTSNKGPINQAKTLQKLGVRPSKALPDVLELDEDEQPEALPFERPVSEPPTDA